MKSKISNKELLEKIAEIKEYIQSEICSKCIELTNQLQEYQIMLEQQQQNV